VSGDISDRQADLYLDLYKFEIERFDSINSRTESHVGMLTGLFAALWLLVMDAVGAKATIAALVIVCAVAALALFMLALSGIYAGRVLLASSARRIGELAAWEQFRKQAIATASAQAGDSGVKVAEHHVAEALARRLREARDDTGRINVERGELLAQSRKWMVGGVAVLVVLGVVRFVGELVART
jgi:hypothetical protein